MKRLFLLTALLLAPLAALHAADVPRVSKDRPDGRVNLASWMADGSFGVMVHYLVKPSGQTRSEQQASDTQQPDLALVQEVPESHRSRGGV
jgi:hypothetical protein